MLHCSLDMARNKFNCYFSFWAIFYPFTSLSKSPKNQNLEKVKKPPWRYHHFTSVPKIMNIWYTVPEVIIIITLFQVDEIKIQNVIQVTYTR